MGGVIQVVQGAKRTRGGKDGVQDGTRLFYCELTFKSMLPELLGRYVTFLPWLSVVATSLAVSIFRRLTKASPARSSALPIVVAASASPSARITLACRSCSA